MKKLADISAFEGLQNRSVHNAVSDIAVFNVSAKEVFDYLLEGARYGDVGEGLRAAVMKCAEDLKAEGITDYEEAGRRADEIADELWELFHKDPEFCDFTYTDGWEDVADNDLDAEPREGSWGAYGGADGICDAFAYSVKDEVRFG